MKGNYFANIGKTQNDQPLDETSDVVSCPYNKQHRITKSRLLWHLQKCQAADKLQGKFGHCRYNFLHIIEKPLLYNHEQHECSDRPSEPKTVEDKILKIEISDAVEAWKRQSLLASQSKNIKEEEEKWFNQEISFGKHEKDSRKGQKEMPHNTIFSTNNSFSEDEKYQSKEQKKKHQTSQKQVSTHIKELEVSGLQKGNQNSDTSNFLINDQSISLNQTLIEEDNIDDSMNLPQDQIEQVLVGLKNLKLSDESENESDSSSDIIDTSSDFYDESFSQNQKKFQGSKIIIQRKYIDVEDNEGEFHNNQFVSTNKNSQNTNNNYNNQYSTREGFNLDRRNENYRQGQSAIKNNFYSGRHSDNRNDREQKWQNNRSTRLGNTNELHLRQGGNPFLNSEANRQTDDKNLKRKDKNNYQ